MLLAAVKMIASVEVLVVLILPASVRSPARVSTRMVPEPVRPVVLPTVPIVNPPETSMTCVVPSKVPTAPPAKVVKLLEILVRVKVPVPLSDNPAAIIGDDCVTAVFA